MVRIASMSTGRGTFRGPAVAAVNVRSASGAYMAPHNVGVPVSGAPRAFHPMLKQPLVRAGGPMYNKDAHQKTAITNRWVLQSQGN